MIVVTVDTRERDDRVRTLLAARADVRVAMKRLPWGDYAIGRTIGIERKSASDLAASVVDGRLFRQLAGVRKHYGRPFLLVEGLRHGEPAANVPWHALRGAIVSAAAMFGVPVLASSGPEETAELILCAARQLIRTTDDGYVRPGYRPRGWRRRALYILQGLPRIGPARANALLDAFGTVRAIVMADADSLASVRGIGSGVAQGLLHATGPQPSE